MKKQILSILGVAVCCVTLVPAAFGYVIDGRLDDWGVTAFTDWQPDSARVEWREADDVNKYSTNEGLGIRTSIFAESRDLEAIYFDNDADYLYWAVVSSIPFDPAYSRTSPYPEDMAIDADGDGIYELGLKIGLLGARTDDGAAIQQDIYQVTRWRTSSGAPYQILQGTDIGDYEIFNRSLGSVEPWTGIGREPRDSGNSWGWTGRTYVLESRIPRWYFGDLNEGDSMRLFLAKYECISDYIWIDGKIDDVPGANPVPEPATMVLLGTSMAGSLIWRRRRG